MYIYWFSSDSGYNADDGNAGHHSTTTRATYRQLNETVSKWLSTSWNKNRMAWTGLVRTIIGMAIREWLPA